MRKIKIYGERNSGTHFLEHLIELISENQIYETRISPFEMLLLKNLKYDFVEDWFFAKRKRSMYGWKHGNPPITVIDSTKTDELPIFLTITKNPYSYLLSLFKNPYHYKGSVPETFAEFIRTPWICRGRDGITPKKLPTPIHLWNIKNRNFLNLVHKEGVVGLNLKYEDLLENPDWLLIQLEKIKSFVPKKNTKIDESLIVKRGGKTMQHYQDYYLNEKWKASIVEQDRTFINQHLDKDVLYELDYDFWE